MANLHNHGNSDTASCGFIMRYPAELVSLTMLVSGMLLNYFDVLANNMWFYLLSAAPVARPIVAGILREWRKLDFFNEYTLMFIAAVGAFYIGEYPEAVAVLLFYSIGEKLEDDASDKARSRIRSLLDGMPKVVRIAGSDGTVNEKSPYDVEVGDLVIVRPGERVAVDGMLEGQTPADFDTSAITGESVPGSVLPGEDVASGCIPIDREVRLKVSKVYADSTMCRIMSMIEDAASEKSDSETLLRKITRWYTPVVMIFAASVFVIPWIVCQFIPGFVFDGAVWLERSLVLLVCSCPCALIVSVPLSYFAALGAASKIGVLFKGSRHLDALRSTDIFVFDKTGTITTGAFAVSQIVAAAGVKRNEVLAMAASLDSGSLHPLAEAIVDAAKSCGIIEPVAENVVAVPHGIVGEIGGRTVYVGSRKLLLSRGVDVPASASDSSEVCVAVDGRFLGAIYLDDMLKPDIGETISALGNLGVKKIMVLSGDREAVVAKTARLAGADEWRGELLPEQKHMIVRQLRGEGNRVVFVGDGINDAPSLAAADVGIAIGGGTDVAMESADAVITGSGISRIVDVFSLSRKIKSVVTKNIILAVSVKLFVIILGALGIASLWAAVFADTGITLITVIYTLMSVKVSGEEEMHGV